MKFTINKNAFFQVLSSVRRAASVHSPLPILSGIYLDVASDHMTLIASDSNISIKEILYANDENQLQVQDTGKLVLESSYILEAVRKLDSDIISIEIVDGALTRLKGNKAEYQINGSKADLYPNIDFSKPEDSFVCDTGILNQMIAQTAFACSTSEDRPVFTGVNMKLSEGVLSSVATDTYRLARKINVLDAEGVSFNITVPSQNLSEVQKSLSQHETVEVAVSDRLVQFHLGDTLIQSRLIDGMFPDVNRLIPETYNYVLTVNTNDLVNAIDRSSFLKSEGYWTVMLEANSQAVTIRSKAQEIGSSEESIRPIDYVGGHLKISFSGRYMIDALKSFKKAVVNINFVGEMQAIVLMDPEDDSLIQLVLPVRTFD